MRSSVSEEAFVFHVGQKLEDDHHDPGPRMSGYCVDSSECKRQLEPPSIREVPWEAASAGQRGGNASRWAVVARERGKLKPTNPPLELPRRVPTLVGLRTCAA